MTSLNLNYFLTPNTAALEASDSTYEYWGNAIQFIALAIYYYILLFLDFLLLGIIY